MLRFGGSSFPPKVYYKVFTATGELPPGESVMELKAKRMLRPGSNASRDALAVMGRDAYRDIVTSDVLEATVRSPLESVLDRISGRDDRIDPEMIEKLGIRAAARHRAVTDERSAWQGGRGNTWRLLGLSSTSFATELSSGGGGADQWERAGLFALMKSIQQPGRLSRVQETRMSLGTPEVGVTPRWVPPLRSRPPTQQGDRLKAPGTVKQKALNRPKPAWAQVPKKADERLEEALKALEADLAGVEDVEDDADDDDDLGELLAWSQSLDAETALASPIVT